MEREARTHFACMTQGVQPFVGVAFYRGNPRYLADNFIMQSTGGPFVHTEFLLGKKGDIRFYTACGAPGRRDIQDGFVPTRRMTSLPMASDWDVVTIPITGGHQGYNRAYAVILRLLALQIPYNYADLWQCCVKLMLPYEKDVQCEDPNSWRSHGVFCSQACLLLVRSLSRNGIIALNPSVALVVDGTNSRGCSPNALHRILHIK
jgi:hypothetical protein